MHCTGNIWLERTFPPSLPLTALYILGQEIIFSLNRLAVHWNGNISLEVPFSLPRPSELTALFMWARLITTCILYRQQAHWIGDISLAACSFRRRQSVQMVQPTIYIGCYDHCLYAISSTGALVWRYLTGNFIDSSSPAIGTGGTVYIGSTDSYLYSISALGALNLEISYWKWRILVPSYWRWRYSVCWFDG